MWMKQQQPSKPAWGRQRGVVVVGGAPNHPPPPVVGFRWGGGSGPPPPPPHHPTQWGSPSVGVTCSAYCLCRDTTARRRVPAHSDGVSGFFGVAKKTRHPTPKGSVKEHGSLTHPPVPPLNGGHPQWGAPVAHTPRQTVLAARYCGDATA
jgi:hypothetical protein